MASLLDNILSFGATPPQYLGGLIGEDQLKNVQNRAMTTGIFNALVGYLATPKNQNLGLGRILGNTLMAGQQGAQGVYDQAIQDYQTTEKIKQMQLDRALQAQKIADQQNMRRLAPQLIREVPAQTELVDQGTYFIPQPTAPDAAFPNYNLQPVVKEPIERVVAPARREIDPAVLQQLLSTSSDPLATLKTTAELVPALRKAGLVQMPSAMDNPFDIFAEGGISPTVRKLAGQYKQSYANGTIDQETAEKRILELGKMDETYVYRTAADQDRDAQREIAKSNTLMSQQIAQGNLQVAQGNLALRQDMQNRQGQKVLPPMAYKTETENLSSAMENVNLANDIDNQIANIGASGINFGVKNNAQYAIKANLPNPDAATLGYLEYQRFATKLVNDTLRLNKGVQTDQDFVRAKQELSTAKSNQDVIRALRSLQEVNLKYAKNKNDLIIKSRKTSGLTEDRGYSAPEQIQIPTFPPVFYSESDPKFQALDSGQVFIDGTTGKRKVK